MNKKYIRKVSILFVCSIIIGSFVVFKVSDYRDTFKVIENEEHIIENNNDNEQFLGNSGDDIAEIKQVMYGKGEHDGKKIAYLTFDDGPSDITNKVLDVLKEHNIKATFFVCGKNLITEGNRNILKRTYEEGHSIGNHCYEHNYTKLYPGQNTNISVFMDEVEKTNELIHSVIGNDFKTRLIRMPNGEMTRRHYRDKNIDKLITKLNHKGMYSVDWNCLTGDEEGRKNKTPDELLVKLKKTSKDKEKLVVLMHDSAQRKNSLDVLPKIIKFLKDQGYEFSNIK